MERMSLGIRVLILEGLAATLYSLHRPMNQDEITVGILVALMLSLIFLITFQKGK